MVKSFKIPSIRKISDSYQITNLLTINDSKNLSVAVSEANNHKETTTTNQDRAYFILEGEITINKETAKKGEIIFIEKGTTYTFQGTFKAVLINSPAFKK